MFFGINGAEAVLILLIAAVVIGPERMPGYARQLRSFAEKARDWVSQGKATVKAELGDDVDLSQLDPRQYDPRRIVREALAEPSPQFKPQVSSPPRTAPQAANLKFDDEAT